MVARLAAIAAAAWLMGIPARAASEAETQKEILALERSTMDAWRVGNPDAALAHVDPEITYFHIMTGKRLDGAAALKALYEGYRGRPLFDSYKLADAKVTVSGDIAVLTYILVFERNGTPNRYNSTQVYRHKKDGWRVIHSHWSQTLPPV